MNDRIRELLEQSGLLSYTKIVVPEHEKFAELIVRECIKICCDVSPYETAEYAGIAIKEHFGVE